MIEQWNKEILEVSSKSNVLGIAIFNTTKQLLFANKGIKMLFKGDPAKSLINPTFEQLLKLSKLQSYSGIITIGDNESLNTSITGFVFQKNNELLILGEIDVLQMSRQNMQLSKLNNENSNLHRSLIKEKKMLQIAHVKLEELNSNKNMLLGTAAHDLRNPIGIAFSYADLMVENVSELSIDEITKYLRTIRQSTFFALQLLESLLDISSIESGQIELKPSQVDFIELAVDSIELNRIFAQSKTIEFELQTNLKEVLLWIDSTRIAQVLSNLISNAIKYSLPHSKIIIRISVDSENVKTEVIDQGQGIAENELDQVFEPFHTTSTKSTAGEKSTGLGLAIVKKIIAMHGGSLSVQSKVDEGSNFTFWLPL